MSDEQLEAPAVRRGRPRDPLRDRAILNAARTVVADKGFTGASMEAIAQHAGVGKDTLYRRWDSKEQLVQHLMTVLADEGISGHSLGDDPRFELFVFLQDVVRLNTESDFGAIVAGVVGESARNPELAKGFHAFWSDRRQIASGFVRQIVGSEPAEDDVERLIDQLVGPIYYRLLLSGDPISNEYLWDLITTIPWPDDSPSSPSRPNAHSPLHSLPPDTKGPPK